MRSFAGRDILSLKDFERNEFEHVFQVADRLEPIARERSNSDLLSHKTLVTAFYLLKDWARLRDWLFGLAPRASRKDVRRPVLQAQVALDLPLDVPVAVQRPTLRVGNFLLVLALTEFF